MNSKKKYLGSLFRLINMLSIGEKKYIGTAFSTKKGNKHQQLYEALKKETVRTFQINKEVLYKRFQRETAKHLFEYILEKMRIYYDGGNNKQFKKKKKAIRVLMLDADFLFERGFYEESFQKLSKAKNKAYQIFHYYAIIEINDRIMDILSISGTQGIAHKIDIKQLVTENEVISVQAKEYTYWKGIYNKLLAFINTPNPSNKEIVQETYKPLFDKSGNFQSYLAYHWYLQALGIYYKILGNTSKVESIYETVMNWWEKEIVQQDYKSEEQYRYLVSLTNLVNTKISAIYLNKYNKNSLELQNQLKICWALLDKTKILNFDNKYEEYIFTARFFRDKSNLYFLENRIVDAKKMFEEEIFKRLNYFSIRDQKKFYCQYIGIVYRQKKFDKCLSIIKDFDKKYSIYSDLHYLTTQKIEVNIFLLGIIIIIQMNLKEKSNKKTIEYFRNICKKNEGFFKNKQSTFASTLLIYLKKYIYYGNNMENLLERKKTLLEIYKLLKNSRQEVFSDDIIEIWIKNNPILGSKAKRLF